MKILLDINTLPSEYKNLDTKEAVEKYKKDFGVTVIPVDCSTKSTGGSSYLTPRVIREENE